MKRVCCMFYVVASITRLFDRYMCFKLWVVPLTVNSFVNIDKFLTSKNKTITIECPFNLWCWLI